MTATRDRRSDPAEDAAETAWDDRPILGASRGLPWWAAVLIAFGLAAVAAVVEIKWQGSLGRIYQIAYAVGCVGAVCWVRRRNLFGPMVQPPLVFAVTAIGAVVGFGDGKINGLKQLVLTVALPLTSNFPTMAITTAVTVAIGLFRLWKQRDPNPPVRSNRRPKQDSAGEDSAPRPTRDRGRPRTDKAADKDSRRSRPTKDPAARDQGNRPRPPRNRDQSDRPNRPSRPTRDQGERGDGPQRRRRPPDQDFR